MAKCRLEALLNEDLAYFLHSLNEPGQPSTTVFTSQESFTASFNTPKDESRTFIDLVSFFVSSLDM